MAVTPYTTKTGRVLSDADIDALADEAERGYEVAALKRAPGRPRLGEAPSVIVPIRIHDDLRAQVDEWAAAEQTSVSEIVRDAVELYLAERPAPLSAQRRQRGRRAQVVPVRMSPELKARVDQAAAAESTSVSEIVRAALHLRGQRLRG